MLQGHVIEGYCTVDHAAVLLNKTYNQLNWTLKRGELPFVKVGKVRLVKLADVEQFRQRIAEASADENA